MLRTRKGVSNNRFSGGMVMKKLKKVIVALLTMVVLSGLFNGVKAEAGTTYTQTNPVGFTNEWERTVFYRNSQGFNRIKLVYGYDQFMINEDYSWSYSYYAGHKAGVENDYGPSWTSVAHCSRWAEEEVMHKGSTVSYMVWVDDNDSYTSTAPVVSDMK